MMEKYLVGRAISLNKQIKNNSRQCEELVLQWLIEESMASLLNVESRQPQQEEVLPIDFTCDVPSTMPLGQSVDVLPQFTPTNTTNTKTTCVSSDSSIVEVSTNNNHHVLKAVGVGTVTIAIVSDANQTIKHFYTITVYSESVIENDVIYYGVLPAALGVRSFRDITGDDVKKYLKKVTATSLDKTPIEFTSAGDLIVVAVLKNKVATSDNGFGDKVEFYSSAVNPDTGEHISSNGDVSVNIDGTEFYLYGEFMLLAGGILYVYVD